MTRCPCCNQLMQSPRDPVGELAEAMRRACADRGHHVLPGDRVREHVAAELLDRAPGTLRNWAHAARPLRYAGAGGRRTYELADLAAFALRSPDD